MAFVQKLPAYIEPDDYLLLEERPEFKREYLDGVIYDWQGGGLCGRAGGTIEHAKVTLNIAFSLRTQLRGTPCTVVSSEVRLNRADKSAYFYPDVMVSCSAADRARNDGFSEPAVVVEVLSPSTEPFDRGHKFMACQKLEGLQSYVLVSIERRTIEVFLRGADWAAGSGQQTTRLVGPEVVALGALDLALRAVDVFEGL